MSEIIENLWFTTPAGLIGIVVTRRDNGEYRANIGTASGFDEQADARHIANIGGKFPNVYAGRLFPQFDKWAD